jgi:hypothetical protein
MNLIKQAYRDKPEEGTWGDCHRTAYAMVLGLERDRVPHVYDKGVKAGVGNAAMREFLLAHGLVEIKTAFPGDHDLNYLFLCLASQCPGVPYVLSGMSANGTNHSVAVLNGTMFDPSLDDSGIIGPCDDGYYWVTYFGLAEPHKQFEAAA